MRLNRHDDAGWRALARSRGISDHIARLLWTRAEADANNDLVKAERAFRRLLDEAKAFDALVLELVANQRLASDPGKSTRVLAEEQQLPGSTAEQSSHESASSPATRLRQALEAAIQSSESVVRTVAASDAKTIRAALDRISRGPGSALAAIDDGALSQLLRLADGFVTMIEQGRGAGEALPAGLRDDLESRIGADLGDLRVHNDPAAAALASKHGAIAFAQGTDVFFADGMYDPSSATGKQLIAHEATHVVQQRGGSRAVSGAMSEPGSAVEREADRVAGAFAAGFAPGAPEFAVSERAAAGTISRATPAATTTTGATPAPTGPKEWKLKLLGQVLDLSSRLASARDGGNNDKVLDINQTLGPLRIQQVRFKVNGDKVASGTLVASVDSGAFKGTSGTLTVDADGQVSGTLNVPVNVPGLFVKQVSIEIGPSSFTGKAKLSPSDFLSPDFPIKTSDFELTVTSKGNGVEVGLTGSAMAAIDNGMAQGQAKMDIDLHVDSSGVTFNATVTGKIQIAGLANADAVIKYDGKAVTIEAGGTIPVQLPGLEGTANIKYEKGKLSLDSKDLHFTLPQLEPVKLDEVQATQSKLAAKLHLGSPITVPLPGGASLTLEQSSIAIDGTAVNGDITGKFALNNAGGLTGTVQLAYASGGDITGSVKIAGGATFTVGGVQITIDNASTLDIAKGMGVSGDIAGKIKVPGIPEIAVHVVAQSGQPIDLTCDANIPLASITPQLGGNVHVQYHRGGGANAFSFEATNVAVTASPINGQVLFSSLNAHLQGNEVTGDLTAASGTVIQAGGTTVTIQGGTIHLLPGKILDGHLQASSQTGGSSAEATVGWKQGKFDWSAEGTFDLGQLTRQQLMGKVHAAAGSNGTGNFVAEGPITFGSPALRGIAITELSGNKETRTFSATIDATQAINKALENVPNVGVTTQTTKATVNYTAAGLAVDGKIDGHAQFPKAGPSQLEGDFHLAYGGPNGFTGSIDKVKITASEYFNSENGTADLQTGVVNVGNATFNVPGVMSGTVTTANINVKTNEFHVEANLDAQAPALKGVQLKVVLNNTQADVRLRENAPPIPLGDFATMTLGAGTSFTLTKGTGLSGHMAGTVDAMGVGKGTFQMDYANRVVTGNAQIHVLPFAIFDAVDLDLKIDANRKLSTNGAIDLRIAPQHANLVAASAKVTITDNKFNVDGKITEVKGLGKISEAFEHGGGAVITYDQASKKVTVSSTFDVGGTVIPELATGSTLQLKYENNLFMMTGKLKPKSYGAVQFSDDSNITARWISSPGRFIVDGQAHAEIAELGTADFSVDAAIGGGIPGSFVLKGKIDPTKLSQHFPGVTFANVIADFSVTIGGGAQRDLDFHFGAAITGIPAAGVRDIAAQIDTNYKSREGLSGSIAITHAKLGDVNADGSIQLEKNKLKSGTLHLAANFPSLTVEGTGTIAASDLGALSTSAELKVTPGGTSPLSKFIQSGNIHVDIQKWKLANAVGQLHLVPPDFLPIENTVIEVGYQQDQGLHATLSTQFNAPMAKHGEKGTFVAGYARDKGLFAHIEFPVTVPGFQAATVAGDLNSQGIKVGATLIPKDTTIVKQANIDIGYDLNGGGLYLQGSITLKPSEELELVVGLRYDKANGLQVLGITPQDKAATPQDHEIANWHKDFPTIPLATVGVASLGLKFGLGVAAGYRMPRIAFKNPKLEGGLEALDKGGMPAFTFGGSIAMGAYIALSISVQIAGEIQLLIATCSAGIGAEIAARLNLDLGADVNGRFAPGQGALLQIDPFVGASLDLVASLIATLHASVCWFTIVDKKWTLASTNFAHIDLGQFHPFNPVGVQIGGPGGTHLTNGLTLRDDAFDQIKEGVKRGATNAGNEEANEEARKRVAPVLRAFKGAAPQFEQLPPGWEKGMTAAPVNFHSMFPVSDDEWNYYQDHADTAEQIDPADAPKTPTERLSKAVGVTARKDPGGAGRLILAWRRAQIAAKGVNPDTGVNVVEEREQVQAHINAIYQAELAAAQQKQKEQDQEHAEHVKKQAADYQTAQAKHVETAQQQKTAHEATVAKTQVEWNDAQKKKTTAAQHAQQEGVQVQPAKQEKAPPPPIPPEPPAPVPLAKPAPIPVPPKVPLPKPPEVLPAVTLPALPQDPGVSVHAAAAIPPQQQKVQPQSPGAKSAPKGGTPDPMPGTSSSAQQVGGGGGGGSPNIGGGNTGGGGRAGGGGATSAAPPPGPAVAAGPDGIISQQKTLDAKEKQLSGGDSSAPAAAPGKPGILGRMFGGSSAAAPAPAGKPAAGPPAPAAGQTAPGATPGAAAKPGDASAGGLDPTVQKVVEQGKADELAYKQKLGQQEQTYGSKVKEEDKATEAEAQKLDKEAEEAKKRKEREKAEAAARAAGAANSNTPGAVGPDGKPLDDKDKKKNKGPIGTRVPLAVDGESHTLYIDETSSVAMVASTPTPVTGKIEEISGSINAAPSIKALAAASVQEAKGDAQPLAALTTKAKGDDAAAAAANSELTSQEQKLAGPLKISWAWAKVAADPAVTGGSIENPLLHPYYATFKQRVAQLSAAGHISVDATQYAESIWTKICKAVKAATPQMNDPAAYSNFAKGWLNMKSPEFQKAIHEFDALGKEMAKAGSAGFARARNFGFWSKDEGRSLAEAISDLTLETSAIGGLMDGLPTLDGKKAGWDPEIWGALSNAYATAVVPELLKGKKVNVCVGAGVAAGNIWEAVESEALAKGLKGTKLTLESVCTNYAAAAKSKANRRELDDTKHTNSIKGCLFVGDRAGAIAAAEAHWKTLDQQPTTPGTTPGGGPGTAPSATDKADPTASTGKPLPPGAPIGTRVPMTVGNEGHTQYIDPSGKPMVASTPTPVTDKLAELNTKLNAMAPTDPKRAQAQAEITRAQSLESKVADLAVQVKKGVATAAADLDRAQRELAVSVGKIWGVADPGMMDAAKAKEAIDSRVKDCTDISAPLSTEWVGKTRAEFESQFIDPNKLRHAAIAKFLSTTPDPAKMQTVGSKDPIAVQKFQDIDAEQHIDPAHTNIKDTYYLKLHAAMGKDTFTDRATSYQVMKAAAGHDFNLKGMKIPANRISPLSARNHSVDKLYDVSNGVAKTLIDAEITRALTAEGAPATAIANAKLNDALRRKTYRHILKTNGDPLSTIDKTKNISPYATWFAPGEIVVNSSAPPNQEFARMMTLGALQPEWYPNGTAVLNIDRRLSGATREIYKPTAFDGLMSALWCARNLGVNDYGVTGGGVGEFLEGNVPFSDVTSMKVIIPSDDFIADMKRVATEVKNKNGDSTPTEEMLRANGKNVRILNTTGSSGVKGMYGQILDRSAEEQNNPSPSPVAPGATQETSTAMPSKAAAAKQGAFDRVEGPKPSANVLTAPVPTGAPTPAAAPQGLAPTSQAPGVPRAGDPATSQGGGQANDGRTTQQTAAGATAKAEHGGLPGESVADAAQRLHPKSERDSHFNPTEKVAFERELARALLSNASMYDAQVNQVSNAILKYFSDRLAAGIRGGVKDAHQKYVMDLAKLTADSSPGWWGAVEVAASATKEEIANQTRQSLTQGSLAQKMAVHQNFINVVKDDFEHNVAQAFLGVAPVVPWYVRQQTKIKNGKLDQTNGVPVFDKANSQERGRVTRPDTHAVSPAGPGVEARGNTGGNPSSVLPTGSDPQQVYRGLDSFTMDEAKDFCQRARLKLNLPLAAGISGSTAELINVAMTMGISGPALQKYAVAVLAYIGGGGNHSYHEIAIVLASVGIVADPDTYHGLEPLIGADLFAELKAKHPDAFHENTKKPENPTGA